VDPIGRLVCDGVPVGTAFLVAPGGLAATAAHVLFRHEAARWAFEPLTARGVSLPVALSRPLDWGADTALIAVTVADDYEPVPLASHASAAPGDPVHLRAFADTRDFDSGTGSYVGEIAENGRSWVKVNCRHAQPGMSGAPVMLTGTDCAIGVVSARLNADRWNRDSVLLARAEDVVALAPEQLRLSTPTRQYAAGSSRRFRAGILRLSWVRENGTELILETDDFNVWFGRAQANHVYLPDHHDHKFHGQLILSADKLYYRQIGKHAVVLSGATRQLKVEQGQSVVVGPNDRLRFASGTVLVEHSAPDIYDPNAGPTSTDDSGGQTGGHH
jgi:hypothetical protein